MSDRAILFLVGVIFVAAALAVGVWLVATHQIGTFDGNYLLLSALIVAVGFGLYLRQMVRLQMKASAERTVAPAKEKPARVPEAA